MLRAFVLAALFCLPLAAGAEVPARVALGLDDELSAPLSKKDELLREKAARRPVRALAPAERAADPMLTLHNVWTSESLPVRRAPGVAPSVFDELVRCHFTNQATSMDQRLLGTVLAAAARFHSTYVEIVSGFRAPKYQLLLRKKGHEVARDSEHPLGHAVDFRIPEVPTLALLRFVRSLHLGGVGYYPESNFVHTDVGRVRFWRGH